MDKVMEFLPFLIPLVIAEFALLGYTLHHILTHNTYKRGNRTLKIGRKYKHVFVRLYVVPNILRTYIHCWVMYPDIKRKRVVPNGCYWECITGCLQYSARKCCVFRRLYIGNIWFGVMENAET